MMARPPVEGWWRQLFAGGAALPLLFVLVSLPSAWQGEASAQSRTELSGPVVRRQLLYRSDRFELNGAPLAMTVGDLYVRNPMLSLSGDYHVTNAISLGVNASLSPVGIKTSAARNFESNNPSRASRVDYARPFMLADVHLGWVPLWGKINYRNSRIIPYDFHIFAGFGGALIASDSDELSGFTAGPTFGFGFRFFFRDHLALRLRVQDYLVTTADAQVRGRPVETSLQHVVLVSAGLSFFTPRSIRVAR